MQVHYIVVFLIGALLGAYYFFVFKKKELKLNGFRVRLQDNMVTYTALPTLCGILLSLIVLAVTPSIIIVKDNKEFKKKDFFFLYTDKSGDIHLLSPCGNYLDNQSSQILTQVTYTYGSVMEELNGKEKDYEIGFHNLGFGRDMDVLFKLPPRSVRGRHSQRVLFYRDQLEKIKQEWSVPFVIRRSKVD